jgi:hypothetical protein
MDREECWGVKGLTRTIPRRITAKGYTVSVHRIEQSLLGHLSVFIETHAVDIRIDPPTQHIARIAAHERKADYLCACALAEMVGIDLDDG